MNREIKFRGKDIKTGKWIFGDKFESACGKVFIIPEGHSTNTDHDTEEVFWQINYIVEVHPDTVGQYTGKKDKNKKEIYGGDRLLHNPDDDEWEDSVQWWPEGARFELKSFIDYPLDEMAKKYKKDKVFKYTTATAMSMAIGNRNCTMLKFADWVYGSENPSLVIGTIHDKESNG